jgi:hypothetical protein
MMFIDAGSYLRHLCSLSIALGAVGATAYADPPQAPTGVSTTQISTPPNLVDVLSHDPTVIIESMPYWYYEAFPDATFVRMYLLPARSHGLPAAGNTIVQVYRPPVKDGHGPMRTRIEIVRGEAPPVKDAIPPPGD